jgi:hypothetical protein
MRPLPFGRLWIAQGSVTTSAHISCAGQPLDVDADQIALRSATRPRLASAACRQDQRRMTMPRIFRFSVAVLMLALTFGATQ